MILPPITDIYDARNIAVQREKNQMLMGFLNGLNDNCENARNQILFLDPLPSMDKAYSMILQVEDKKLFVDTSSSVAMSVRQNHVDQESNHGKQYQFKGRKARKRR